MTNHSDRPSGSSLPFAFGILFGVAATFLFGTDEGRKIVKKVVDSIPEKQSHSSNSTDSSLRVPDPGYSHGRGTPTWQSPFTEETQHHSTYEAPPPPPPVVRHTRPEPFTPEG